MNLIDIFNQWDLASASRTSTFRLKKSKEISLKDSPYEIAVKQLTNYRIEHRLSLTDISEALGMSHETVASIEEFRGSENWLYVYAMNYIFMRYEEHCLVKKGFIFSTSVKQ